MATQKINGVYHVSNTEQGGGGGSDPNAVKYTPQTLTDGQKEQARTNIGAGTYTKPSSGIPASDLASGVVQTDVVKYSSQSLTNEQKSQARQNIGAGTSDFSGDPIVSITAPNPYDGSLIFTKASGDTVTVDLNHDHPAYPKYQLCEDEAEYQAMATKESDKLYLIPETSA